MVVDNGWVKKIIVWKRYYYRRAVCVSEVFSEKTSAWEMRVCGTNISREKMLVSKDECVEKLLTEGRHDRGSDFERNKT